MKACYSLIFEFGIFVMDKGVDLPLALSAKFKGWSKVSLSQKYTKSNLIAFK